MKKTLFASFALIIFSLSGFSQDNCDEADQQYLADNLDAVQAIAAECGQDCAFAADPETCTVQCMQEVTPLTEDCLGCFAGQVECAISNCFVECVFGTEDACAECITENCLDDFLVCAGIFDDDLDGYTTLTDCDDNDPTINPDAEEIWYDGIDQNCDGLNDFDQDQDGDLAIEFGGNDCDDTDPSVQGGAITYFMDVDQDGFGDLFNSVISCVQPAGTVLDNNDCDDTNSSIYPDAPGTGEDIDNNCDGSINGDEVSICMGDLDGDDAVNSNDLLVLLSNYGCTSDCYADLTGDDVVAGADILIFLSFYGTFCD